MKNIKKNDFILFSAIISISIILIALLALFLLNNGETVIIRVDGNEYASLPLSKDTELLIKTQYGENLLIIKDSVAYVESASCPKQVCVRSGHLTEITPIICKHNHVSITLE